MKPLDFMIIGAQKSATTALHSYLAGHPRLAMPVAKEAPFFDGDDTSDGAWETFARKHYAGQESRLWGKASPQYMGHPDAPARIAASMPDTRLIAILRDPVDRAWSHYQMARRRETEDRSFDQAVTDGLCPARLRRARQAPPPRHLHGLEPEGDFYLAWGEYGRILGAYLAYFPRQQMLLLTTNELRTDPAGTLDRVLQFIGLEPGYRPANLGQVVHKGASEALIKQHWRRRLRSLAPVSWAWQLLSEPRKEALRFWLEQKNVRRTAPQQRVLSALNQARLQEHFASDSCRLQRDFDLQLPWSEDYVAARQPVAICNSPGVAYCEKPQFFV